MKRIIGLTGGIATGKTEVSNLLKKQDFEVVCCDAIAHEILYFDSVKKQISEQISGKVFFENGEIDRKKLGEVVFSDPQKREVLNKITHKVIFDEVILKINNFYNYKSIKKPIILDAPLLFETPKFLDLCSKTIVVYTDGKTQFKRLKNRDGLSELEAIKKIESQMPLAKKVEKADFVIDNNGSLKDLEKEVKEMIRFIIT